MDIGLLSQEYSCIEVVCTAIKGGEISRVILKQAEMKPSLMQEVSIV